MERPTDRLTRQCFPDGRWEQQPGIQLRRNRWLTYDRHATARQALRASQAQQANAQLTKDVSASCLPVTSYETCRQKWNSSPSVQRQGRRMLTQADAQLTHTQLRLTSKATWLCRQRVVGAWFVNMHLLWPPLPQKLSACPRHVPDNTSPKPILTSAMSTATTNIDQQKKHDTLQTENTNSHDTSCQQTRPESATMNIHCSNDRATSVAGAIIVVMKHQRKYLS